MQSIINLPYFGEISMLLAAICWSIAVIIFKSASKSLSPLLIVTLKNSIALLLFTMSFLLFDIQIFYKGLTTISSCTENTMITAMEREEKDGECVEENNQIEEAVYNQQCQVLF